MSIYVKNLVAVQQKIEDLLKKKTKLKKKEQKGALTDDEEIELDGVAKLLAVLENDEKFWQGQVDKENQPEEIEYQASFESASNQEIKAATGVHTDSPKDWNVEEFVDFEIPLPEDFVSGLCYKLSKMSLVSEADRRIVLDHFLFAVIGHTYFEEKLRLSCEVSGQVERSLDNGRKRQKLTGSFDYLIYHCRPGQPYDEVSEKQAHLVTVEAKSEFPDKSLRQCVAEAAAIHKARKDAAKQNCQCWGVVSNAQMWKFIHIDDEGYLYRSGLFSISSLDPNRIKPEELAKLYRLLFYVVKCAYEASPTTTPTRRRSQ